MGIWDLYKREEGKIREEREKHISQVNNSVTVVWYRQT